MSAGHDLVIETPNDRLQDADQVVRLHAATDLGSMDEEAGAALPVLFQTGDDQDRILAFLPWVKSARLWKKRFPALFAVDDEDDEDDLDEDEDDLDEDDEDDLDEDLDDDDEDDLDDVDEDDDGAAE